MSSSPPTALGLITRDGMPSRASRSPPQLADTTLVVGIGADSLGRRVAERHPQGSNDFAGEAVRVLPGPGVGGYLSAGHAHPAGQPLPNVQAAIRPSCAAAHRGTARRSPRGRCAARSRAECLLDVVDEVVGVLDADRQPYEVAGHLEQRAGDRLVRHAAGVLDE
ncbi:hypothetical protein BH23ACT7_BH23ACT7_06670 [soil metagenome]